MKKVSQNLSEINAEMLLHYLYPEMDDKWTVEHLGTFYRNFNSDLIGYDEESGEVQVARDGYTKLLPAGMLFSDSSLKGKGQKTNISKLKDRQLMLREMFQPIDNVSFKRRMSVEREVSDLLDSKMRYVLTTFFHYDPKAEENEYVRQIAYMLPLVRNIRGDYMTIRNILAVLFECEVTCTIGRYSDTDQTRSWIPQVAYELQIEGLDPESYEKMASDVEQLRLFMQEWFFPFDVQCIMTIKWHHQSMSDTDHWLLDYNTELKV